MLHSSSLGFIDIFCVTRLVISTQDSIPSKICYVSLIFSVNQYDWSILYYHMWHSTVKFCFPYYTQGMQRVLGKVKNHELVHNGQPRSQLLYFYRLVFLPGMMQFILFYSEENILVFYDCLTAYLVILAEIIIQYCTVICKSVTSLSFLMKLNVTLNFYIYLPWWWWI